MKRVNFHLTDDLIERLRRRSEETGAPAAELVRRAVERYLADPAPGAKAGIRASRGRRVAP